MEAVQLQLDVDRHRALPYLQDGGRLHTINPAGDARRFNIARTEAFSDRDLWEVRTDVEEVGVTPDGRWLLVRTTDTDALVWVFATRDALCRFLWESVDYDPAALTTLHYLGALRFDPDCPKSGSET